MNKNNLIFGLAGLIIGSVVTGIVCNQMSVKQTVTEKISPTPMVHDMHTMDSMVSALNGKTGDAFDKQFISDMIIHHQGAIDMAKRAKEQAGHEEIKTLSEEIISAQTTEIEQMSMWQKEWGYK